MFVIQMYIMLIWPWVMKRFSLFSPHEKKATI